MKTNSIYEHCLHTRVNINFLSPGLNPLFLFQVVSAEDIIRIYDRPFHSAHLGLRYRDQEM